MSSDQETVLDQLVTPEEVARHQSLLERVGDEFGTDDDVLRALLTNQVVLGRLAGGGGGGGGTSPALLRAVDSLEASVDALGGDVGDVQEAIESLQQQEQGIQPGTIEVTDRLDRLLGLFGDIPPPSPTPDAMPEGALGVALDNIGSGREGPALFYPGGGRTRLTVRANGDVDNTDVIEVVRNEEQDDGGRQSVVEPSDRGQAMFSGVTIDKDSTLETGQGETVTLDDSKAMTLTVDTIGADDVVLTIDDGTAGNKPPQYTLVERVYDTDFGEFVFYDQTKNIQKRSVANPAVPPRWQAKITNTSGNDNQNYRATLKAISRRG